MKVVLPDEDILKLEAMANFLVEEESEFGWFCHGFCVALCSIFSKDSFPKRQGMPQQEVTKWITKLLLMKDEITTRAAMYLMDESSGIEAHRRKAMILRRFVEGEIRKVEKKGEQNGGQ